MQTHYEDGSEFEQSREDLEVYAKYAIKLEDNFYEFVKEAWRIVDGDKFIPTYHIQVICEHLQAVANRDIIRLIINIPPAFAKSLIVSVLFPAWLWARDPSWKILSGTSSRSNAHRDTVKSRDLIKSEWFQYFFGSGFSLAGDQNEKSYYKNDKFGHRVSFSTTSGYTGLRCNFLLLDDALSIVDQYSELKINFVNENMGPGLITRLNDQHNDPAVVMGQRLRSKDLTGFLQAKGGWETLSLPLEFEESRRCKTSIFTDSRKEGELLWPERWTKEKVEQTKKTMGSRSYAAQYKQNPVDEEGGIIKPKWFKYYKQAPEFTMVVDSWDTAFGEKETNDYSVCTTWGISQNKLCLLNVFRERVGMPMLKRAIIDIHNKYGSNQILIEDAASGKPAKQELAFMTTLPIKLIKPVSSKISRAHAAAPTIEAENMYLPEEATWLYDYVQELAEFPASAHDDQVDSTTQFINHHTKDIPIVPTIGIL